MSKKVNYPDWMRRLSNSSEELAENLILRGAFTTEELAGINRYLDDRAQRKEAREFWRRKAAFLRKLIRNTGKVRPRPAVAAVFMLELANGDCGLAWRAVTKDILTAEELARLTALLKFQEPSNKLRDLVAAVELRDPRLPHSEVPRKKG
jgi:hypothetical protein